MKLRWFHVNLKPSQRLVSPTDPGRSRRVLVCTWNTQRMHIYSRISSSESELLRGGTPPSSSCCRAISEKQNTVRSILVSFAPSVSVFLWVEEFNQSASIKGPHEEYDTIILSIKPMACLI